MLSEVFVLASFKKNLSQTNPKLVGIAYLFVYFVLELNYVFFFVKKTPFAIRVFSTRPVMQLDFFPLVVVKKLIQSGSSENNCNFLSTPLYPNSKKRRIGANSAAAENASNQQMI